MLIRLFCGIALICLQSAYKETPLEPTTSVANKMHYPPGQGLNNRKLISIQFPQ